VVRESWTLIEKLEHGRYGEHSNLNEKPMAKGFVDPR